MRSIAKHILLTRYNIGFSVARRAGVRPLKRDYLKYRDELFRRFCVPTVAAQTSRDFEWFVLFHPNTPPSYYDLLDGIATVVLGGSLREAWAKIKPRLPIMSPVLSTRLDNDDSIAPEFIALTRRAADKALSKGFANGGDFVVTPQLAALASLAERKWRLRRSVSPPFISLVNRPRLFRRRISVLHFDHVTHARLPLVQVKYKEPLWLGIMHGQNLAQRWDPRPDQDRSFDDPPPGFSFIAELA